MTKKARQGEGSYIYANVKNDFNIQSQANEQEPGAPNNEHNFNTMKFENPLTYLEVNEKNYTPFMKNRKNRESNIHSYQQLQKESMQDHGNTLMIPLSHGNEQPNQNFK